MTPKIVADFESSLATAIAIGATTFTLSSATDDDGVALPAGLYCLTVDNGSTQKEYLVGQLNGVNMTSVKSVSRQGVETTGAVRAHRVGASILLTDFSAIKTVVDILNGVSTLSGASPVGYNTEPTLSDRKSLATVGYVLDRITGGTVSFESQTTTGNGGEAIVAGNLVYFNSADQEWYKANATTSATVENLTLGIALGAGSDGVAIAGGILLQGIYTTTGLTAGSLYYASNTAGAIATTAGTVSKIVARAHTTTRLMLFSSNSTTVTTREKDALAGGGAFGTPGAGNKFLTEAYGTSSFLTKASIVRGAIASATSKHSNNTLVNHTFSTLTLTHQITIKNALTTCRVQFDLARASGLVSYQVNKNGSSIASASSVGPGTLSVDVGPFLINDTIQILSATVGGGATTISTSNVRLLYDNTIVSIDGSVLITPLVWDGVGLPAHINNLP